MILQASRVVPTPASTTNGNILDLGSQKLMP